MIEITQEYARMLIYHAIFYMVICGALGFFIGRYIIPKKNGD